MSGQSGRLRATPTPAEIRFWRLIHPLRKDWHFRKQVPMGPYVADFVSHKARLVVEIDGDTHFIGDGPDKDRRRDAALAAKGYFVLRFTNDEVMHNPGGVYDTLLDVLKSRSPPSERR